jgi:fructokinase
MYGGIEAGGTKFVCGVAPQPDEPLVARTVIPTTQPEETLARTIEFFRPYTLEGLGVASFGPIDLHEKSATYGYITTTPKPGWGNCDLIGPLREALKVPVKLDTDVNGAALGEWRYGAGKGSDQIVYYTIGTGIGGGAIANGLPVHGLTHPEMGHVPVKRHPKDDYAGYCPYHKDCLEGMASGPAMESRWGIPASQLAPDHIAWEIEAHYLAQAISSVVFILSPQRVILGGGVMHQPQLFPLIQQKVLETLAGYVHDPAIIEHIDTFIVPPGLGDNAGITGALELAKMAALAR